jgi:hypothetical protein
MKHAPAEYVAIKQWGAYVGSFAYYWQDQQAKASADGAPLDAIYAKHNHDPHAPREWTTVRDLAEDHPFRDAFNAGFKQGSGNFWGWL